MAPFSTRQNFGIAVPAGQGLAVEDGLVAGFLDGRNHGAASGAASGVDGRRRRLLGGEGVQRRDAENAEEARRNEVRA